MRLHFEPPGRDRIKFAFGHGRFLDAWSVVHLLSGLLMGIVLVAFAVPLVSAFLVVVALATLYEAFEMVTGIIENLANVIVDVVLATIGLLAAYWLLAGRAPLELALAFAAIGAIDLVLVYLGWRHHLRYLVRQRNSSRERLGESNEPS